MAKVFEIQHEFGFKITRGKLLQKKRSNKEKGKEMTPFSMA
jgi:hypothetical protein